MYATDPDAFLNQFVTSDDELQKRMACYSDFGAPLATAKADVPLYDQYNRGLTLCQDNNPRTNLALEGKRPGMTGYIPSMEEAMEQYPSSSPRPQKLVLSLGAPGPAVKRGLGR
jgi:hypothetical protein